MKKIIIHQLVIVLGIFFMGSFSGCKKNDPNPSKPEMLSISWKVGSVTINGTIDNITDYNNYSYTFNTDGTYNFTTPNTVSGTWELNSTETKIILHDSVNGTSEMVMISISSKNVILELTKPETFKTSQEIIVYKLIRV
jgi:hypothetical protein